MDVFAIIPVLAAAAANVVLGALWYHPRVFGASWMRGTNVTPEAVERGLRRAHIYSALALGGNIAFAATMLVLERAAGVATLPQALLFAALLTLGIVMPVVLGQYLWEHKPARLFLLNLGFWLITAEMTAVIVFFRS